MTYILLTLTFLIVNMFLLYLYMQEKHRAERKEQDIQQKTFENTIFEIVTAFEKTNTKFYDMASRIETEHFKQLTAVTDKQNRLFDRNIEKFFDYLEEQEKKKELSKEKERLVELEKITRLDAVETNPIEKEQQIQDPLEELTPANFANIKNIGFEGEEKVYPVA